MSRIGSAPISIPSSVSVEVQDDAVTATGPKGSLSVAILREVTVNIGDGKISVSPKTDNQQEASLRARAMWGLTRSLISNIVTGVSEGFTRSLELRGVGYRALLKGRDVQLSLGFSHPVVFSPPEGVTLTCPTNTRIEVSGIDKQVVGQTAANIRRFRPPEPYKGKGIRYVDEFVRMKDGKKK